MSLRVKCILCGNKLIIQKDETAPLLEHIKSSHPDINVSKSDLNIINTTCEEKKLSNEIQLGNPKQNYYENRKDEDYKILEGGDWERSENNSAPNTFRKEINVCETNLKVFNNGQSEITCPGNDIKLENQKTDEGELDQLLPRESVQKFIGWQYKQSQEITNQAQKFDGVQFQQQQQQPSEHELNIPLKVSIMNNGKIPRVVYKRRYKIKGIPMQYSSRSASTEALYKNSLQKWKLERGIIFCPKCGAKKHPTIKTNSNKISDSPLGAACILTCWPLCFLPCLFPPATTEYLYCSVCNHLLGTYDRKTEVIQPITEKTEKKESKQNVQANNPTRKDLDHAQETASDVK